MTWSTILCLDRILKILLASWHVDTVSLQNSWNSVLQWRRSKTSKLEIAQMVCDIPHIHLSTGLLPNYAFTLASKLPSISSCTLDEVYSLQSPKEKHSVLCRCGVCIRGDWNDGLQTSCNQSLTIWSQKLQFLDLCSDLGSWNSHWIMKLRRSAGCGGEVPERIVTLTA